MHSKPKSIKGDEAEMISGLESGGYESLENERAEIQRYAKIFRESGNNVKRVSIRMTEWHVQKAQAMAMRQGLPYATLLTSILHKYFSGKLKESH